MSNKHLTFFFFFFNNLPAVGLFLVRTESGLRNLQMLLLRSILRRNFLHNFTRSHTLLTFYGTLQSLPEKRRMMHVLTLLRFMSWYKIDLDLVVFKKKKKKKEIWDSQWGRHTGLWKENHMHISETSPLRFFLIKIMICSCHDWQWTKTRWRGVLSEGRTNTWQGVLSLTWWRITIPGKCVEACTVS